MTTVTVDDEPALTPSFATKWLAKPDSYRGWTRKWSPSQPVIAEQS